MSHILFGNEPSDVQGFAAAVNYHLATGKPTRAFTLLVGRGVAQLTLEELCGPFGKPEPPLRVEPERRGSPAKIANLFLRANQLARLARIAV
jgi:hypothetical protein